MKWIITAISQLLFSLLLVACADTPGMPLITDPTPTPAKPADVLNIYSQEQDIEPTILANFEAQFKVKVNLTTATDHPIGLDDIRAELADYDLAVLNDTTVASLRPEGLFAPLNKENIPNFGNLDPAFANPLFDPGNRYCVAYQWGTMGLGHTLPASKVQSWADFFKATSPLRLGLPNDSRLSLAAALLFLGYSPNTTNDLEIAEANGLLEQHSGQLVAYAPGTSQALLTGGQVDLVFARSGAILQLMAANPAIHYTIPSEGSLIWIDNLCLLANTSHPMLAETFINYILDPQVGATLANSSSYSSPNQAALPLLSLADRNNPALYPDDNIRKRLFFLVNVGPTVAQLYNQTWANLVANPNFQAPPKSN